MWHSPALPGPDVLGAALTEAPGRSEEVKEGQSPSALGPASRAANTELIELLPLARSSPGSASPARAERGPIPVLSRLMLSYPGPAPAAAAELIPPGPWAPPVFAPALNEAGEVRAVCGVSAPGRGTPRASPGISPSPCRSKTPSGALHVPSWTPLQPLHFLLWF